MRDFEDCSRQHCCLGVPTFVSVTSFPSPKAPEIVNCEARNFHLGEDAVNTWLASLIPMS